jgi:predicted dehydrogenase
MSEVRIGLIGAGNIGQRHIMAIDQLDQAHLIAIADPSERAAEQARARDIAYFPDVPAMLAEAVLDAVIIATPTERHHQDVCACLEKVPAILVEKPIAADTLEAQDLTERAEIAGCHVLVGHQRRYYPCVTKAKELIESGAIGTLLGVSGQWTCRKDEAYYTPDWRRIVKAGPILTNLIHEIDLLRYICGEITQVSAHINHLDQDFEKEDTAALTMQFANQAVGTFLISDRAPSPWTWEFALGENIALPKSGQNALRFIGSSGALEFPNLTLWKHAAAGGDWKDEILPQKIETPFIEAYIAQIEHLCAVVHGKASPLISAHDASQSLKVTLAVRRSAAEKKHILI